MHTNDPTPRSATRLDVASDTIEDYLATARPPVADHLEGRFTVVQRDTVGGPAADLVTVDDHGELLHVRRPALDETVGNDAGWMCTPQAVPDTRRRRPGESLPERGPIHEITAFAQGSKTYALVHYAGAGGVRHVEPIVHDHSAPPEDRRFRVFVTDGDLRNALSANSQNAVFRDRDGRHYLYGAAVNFRPDTATLFIAAEGRDGAWQAYAARVPGDAGTTFRLLPAPSSRHQFIVLKIDDERLAVQESRLLAEEGYEPRIDLADDAWRPASLATITGPELRAGKIHPLPAGTGGGFLLHTAAGQLHLVAGPDITSPRVTLLSGGAGPTRIASVSVGRDDQRGPDRLGRFQSAIFAVETHGDLRRVWICRQADADEHGAPVFTRWSCLGNDAATIGCPAVMTDGPELYLVGEGGGGAMRTSNGGGLALGHLVANPRTTMWHTQEIEAPRVEHAEEPCTTHTTILHAIASDGQMVPRAAVELAASHACVAVVNGVARQLGPTLPVRTIADDTGRITVKIKADSLNAPELTATLSAGTVAVFRPDSAIARRLAGKDPRFPMTGERLKQAGVLPADLDAKEAANVALMLRRAGETIGAQQAGRPPPSGATDEFSFDLEPALQSFAAGAAPRRLVTHRRLKPSKRARASALMAMDVGPAANGLFDWVGDVIHWFKTTLEPVGRVIVRIGQGVLDFALRIGTELKNFVVKTAEGIGRFLEGLFAQLGKLFHSAVDGAKRLVNLLRAAFEWEDIVVTNEVLRTTIDGGLGFVQDLIGNRFSGLVNDGIDEGLRRLDGALAEVEKVAGSLSVAGARAGKVPGDDRGAAAGGMDFLDMNRVQTSYVADRVAASRDRIRGDGSDPFKGDQDFATLVAELLRLGKDKIEATGLTLHESLMKIVRSGDLLGEGLPALVRLLRGLIDVAAFVAKAVITLILKVIAKAIGWLRGLFATPMPIPGLSAAYRAVAGRELQILDIFTLLLAAPGTILFKLTHGGAPPFPRRDQLRPGEAFVLDAMYDTGLFERPQELAFAAAPARSEPPGRAPLLVLFIYMTEHALRGGKIAEDRLAELVAFTTRFQGALTVMAPLATVIDFCKVVTGPIQGYFGAARDGLNAVAMGSGTIPGRISTGFTVVNIITALPRVVTILLEYCTAKFLPETPRGKLLIAQRKDHGGLGLPYIIFGLSVATAIVDAAITNLHPEPISAAVISGIIMTLNGCIGIPLTLVYTTVAFVLNHARPHEIIGELAAVLPMVPTMLNWMVMIVWVTKEISSGATAILMVPVLAADVLAPHAYAGIRLGTLIADGIGRDWREFRPAIA